MTRRRKIASIAEFAEATGQEPSLVWEKFSRPGAPPATLISNESTAIRWLDDGVAYLSGERREKWSAPPRGVVGIADIARAVERVAHADCCGGTKRQDCDGAGVHVSSISKKLSRPGTPAHDSLQCGPVYRSLGPPLEYCLTRQKPGRKAVPGRGRAAEGAAEAA